MTKQLSLSEIVALPAPEAAPLLLGTKIISTHESNRVESVITELEAYTQDDPASHTFRGRSERNKAMFGPAGHAYVYFTYGMHYCLNIVCGPEGRGEGILIRGIQVIEGIEIAIHRRYGDREPTLTQLKNLSNGPGKVVQALGVSMADYGSNLLDPHNAVHLQPGGIISSDQISQSPRIGISQGVETLWRWQLAI